MVPLVATLVPRFVMVSRVGLRDTFWGIVLPSVFGSPYAIFLLRQFFLAIPEDLISAARRLFRYEWIWDKGGATGFANARRMPMRRYEQRLNVRVCFNTTTWSALIYTRNFIFTVSGSTLTITGSGTVTVLASQAATANYTSTTAQTSFTVNPATPTLTFTAISTKTNGVAPFTVSASSASAGVAAAIAPSRISGLVRASLRFHTDNS